MGSKSQQGGGWVWAILGLVGLGALFGGGEGGSSDAKVNAMVNVKNRIASDVRSPSTVDHPILDVDFHKSGTGYEVRSYFDAENVFGGTVRTHYTAKVDSEGNLLSIIYSD
jgi:hypothetical protein